MLYPGVTSVTRNNSLWVEFQSVSKSIIKRVIGLIREKWQETHTIIRGDSAYSREYIMKWWEEQPRVDYILAMATNSQLKLRASDILEKAKADYDERLEPVTKLMETFFSPNEELDCKIIVDLAAKNTMQAF